MIVEEVPAPDDKILDLDELIEPSGSFRLGGVLYNFKEFGALSLLEQHEIDRFWDLAQKIKTKKKTKPSDQEVYERCIRNLIPLISTMPESMVAQQEFHKLVQACVCFFSFRTASQIALVVRMSQVAGKGDPSIGGTSSLASIASGLKQTL